MKNTTLALAVAITAGACMSVDAAQRPKGWENKDTSDGIPMIMNTDYESGTSISLSYRDDAEISCGYPIFYAGSVVQGEPKDWDTFTSPQFMRFSDGVVAALPEQSPRLEIVEDGYTLMFYAATPTDRWYTAAFNSTTLEWRDNAFLPDNWGEFDNSNFIESITELVERCNKAELEDKEPESDEDWTLA